ncbi:MAG: adenylate/guanylate cyclase domain-containing protein [Candidatus Eisenbacteria bacterium]|uniref:Adenylate/guanylate cyclase domain-containing protein n=1 Tax=Eiseniibacteriota bacterium TaxID=2212470 RepID=A0A956NCJ3_UNCEI|nr:adenylate/guanylate cyclase domain-containing protein [Candidatus Eisenbacteria bacterium]
MTESPETRSALAAPVRREHLVILFADLANSSRLHTSLGDVEASRILLALLGELEQCVHEAGGTTIDRIGDELFCRFGCEESAVRCAIGLQSLARDIGQESQQTLALRTGIHGGTGLVQGGRPTAEVVYVAKRLTDSAKPGQILLSEDVLRRVSDPTVPTRFVETARPRGSAGAHRIHELLWGPGEVTLRSPSDLRGAGAVAGETWEGWDVVLELSPGDTGTNARRTRRAATGASESAGSPLLVGPGDRVSIGREEPADLVVAGGLASRLHAWIEGRSRSFVLTDVSTNGTFLRTASDGRVRRIHRDQSPLPERGWIGLGRPPIEGSTHTLRFEQRRRTER